MSVADGGFYSATDADSAGPDGRRRGGTLLHLDAGRDHRRARRRGRAPRHRRVRRHRRGQLRGPQHPASRRAPPTRSRRSSASPRRRCASPRRGACRRSTRRARAGRRRCATTRSSPRWNGLMISALRARRAGPRRRGLRATRGARRGVRPRPHARRRPPAAQLRRRRRAPRRLPRRLRLPDRRRCSISTRPPASARWLDEAIALDASSPTHFEDARPAASSRPPTTTRPLLAREKPAYDGAEPSGNSVQALNLLRLHELTDRRPLPPARRARRCAPSRARLADARRRWPRCCSPSTSLDGEPKEIVIVAPHGRGERGAVPRRAAPAVRAQPRAGGRGRGPGPRPPGRARAAAGREDGGRRQGDRLRLQAAGLRAADVGPGGVRQAAPGWRTRARDPVAIGDAGGRRSVGACWIGIQPSGNGRRRSARPPARGSAALHPAQRLGRGAQGTGRNGAAAGVRRHFINSSHRGTNLGHY